MIRFHRFYSTLLDFETDARGWMLELQLFGWLLQVSLVR